MLLVWYVGMKQYLLLGRLRLSHLSFKHTVPQAAATGWVAPPHRSAVAVAPVAVVHPFTHSRDGRQ